MNSALAVSTARLSATILFTLLMGSGIASGDDSLLCGNWRGSWKSCTTGHRGKLNARFCQIDSNHVQATFQGTFFKVIPFRYRPTLTITHQEPGLMVLSGSRRLPLMGNFEYRAVVTPNQFQATYRSRNDYGHWQMSR